MRSKDKSRMNSIYRRGLAAIIALLMVVQPCVSNVYAAGTDYVQEVEADENVEDVSEAEIEETEAIPEETSAETEAVTEAAETTEAEVVPETEEEIVEVVEEEAVPEVVTETEAAAVITEAETVPETEETVSTTEAAVIVPSEEEIIEIEEESEEEPAPVIEEAGAADPAVHYDTITGSIKWTENGVKDFDKSEFRPAQRDVNLTLTVQNLDTGEVSTVQTSNFFTGSTNDPYFMTFDNSMQADTTWNVSIKNIPDRMAVIAVQLEEVKGYSASAPLELNTASGYNMEYTIALQNVVISNVISDRTDATNDADCMYNYDIRVYDPTASAEEDHTFDASINGNKKRTVTIPAGYTYEIKERPNSGDTNINFAPTEANVGVVTGVAYKNAEAVTYSWLHIPTVESLDVKKIWNDGQNKYNSRPANNSAITFQLYYKLVALDAAAEDGVVDWDQYTLFWDSSAAYTDSVSVAGLKIDQPVFSWAGNLYSIGELPESITVKEENGSYVFDQNGTTRMRIVWAVKENTLEDYVAHYEYTDGEYYVTNTYVGAKFTGTVTFNDNARESSVDRTGVKIQLFVDDNGTQTLYKDGKMTVGSTVITADADGYYTIPASLFTNDEEGNGHAEFTISELPAYTLQAKAVSYIAKETLLNADDYEILTYDNGSESVDTTQMYNKGEVINVLTETIDFEGTKNWIDVNDCDRPETTSFVLYRCELTGGTLTQEDITYAAQVASVDDDTVKGGSTSFNIKFENLPRYSDKGYEYLYFVRETMSPLPDDAHYDYEAEYSQSTENQDAAFAEHIMYDGGSVLNRPVLRKPIYVQKTWYAQAYQNDIEKYEVEIGILRKVTNADGTYYYTNTDVRGRELTTKSMDFIASAMNEAIFNVSKYDMYGQEVEYLVYEKKVFDQNNNVYYEAQIADYANVTAAEAANLTSFTYNGIEGRKFECSVETSVDNTKELVEISNSLVNKQYYVVDKTWSNLTPYELTFNIVQYNKLTGEATGNSVSITAVPDGNSVKYKTSSYVGVDFTEGGRNDVTFSGTTAEKSGHWVSSMTAVPLYGDDGTEYQYLVTETPNTNQNGPITYRVVEFTEGDLKGASQVTAYINNTEGPGVSLPLIRLEKKWIVAGDTQRLQPVYMAAAVTKTADGSQYYVKDIKLATAVSSAADVVSIPYVVSKGVQYYILCTLTSDLSEARLVELSKDNYWIDFTTYPAGIENVGYTYVYTEVWDDNGTMKRVQASPADTTVVDGDGMLFTSGQVYEVTYTSLYYAGHQTEVTNKRVGDVTFDLEVNWQDPDDTKRPDTLYIQITGSNGKIYDVPMSPENCDVTADGKWTIKDDATYTVSVYEYETNEDGTYKLDANGNIIKKNETTMTVTGKMTLPRYDRDTAEALSYIVHERDADMPNERLIFTKNGKTVKYTAEEGPQTYTEASDHYQNNQSAVFYHTIYDNVNLKFYKVWDDNHSTKRPDLNLELYASYDVINEDGTRTETKVEVTDANYQSTQLSDTEYTGIGDAFKLVYHNLPRYTDQGQIITYSVKEKRLASGAYKTYYYETLDLLSGNLDACYKPAQKIFTFTANEDADNTEAPENGAILNIYSQTRSFSVEKEWLGFEDENVDLIGITLVYYVYQYVMDDDGNYNSTDFQAKLEVKVNVESNALVMEPATISNLPKYDTKGRKIKYELKEEGVFLQYTDESGETQLQDISYAYDVSMVNDSRASVKNDYAGEKNTTVLEVSKKWTNLSIDDRTPAVKYDIYRVTASDVAAANGDLSALISGKDILKTVTIPSMIVTEETPKAADGTYYVDFTKKVSKLRKYTSKGEAYYYVVFERNVKGYKLVSITDAEAQDVTSRLGLSKTVAATETTSEKLAISFVNEYTPETKPLSGTKTWDDWGNGAGLRPEDITIKVFRQANAQEGENNGISRKDITERVKITWTSKTGDTWYYKVTDLNGNDLPKYAPNGSEWIYSVTETVDFGSGSYRVSYNGLNITNKLIGEYSVYKQWGGDENDQYGLRPTSVNVQLQYYDEASDSWKPVSSMLTNYTDVVTLDKTKKSGDYWIYTWTKLPKTVSYRAVEVTKVNDQWVTVDNGVINQGYTVTYTNRSTNTLITNTLVPTDVTIQKTWIDDDDYYGVRPTKIKFIVWYTKTDLNGNYLNVEDGKPVYTQVMYVQNNEPLRIEISTSDMVAGSKSVWKKTFTDLKLPKYDAYGNLYTYIVKEIQLFTGEEWEDYELKNSQYVPATNETHLENELIKNADLLAEKKFNPASAAGGTVILEAVYRVKKVGADGTVTYTDWTRFPEADRAHVRVTLDGTADTVSAAVLQYEYEPYKAKWTKLPAKDDFGNDLEYNVVEIDANGNIQQTYIVTENVAVNDIDVKNTNTTSLTIKKNISDYNNKYGLRPGSAYFTLYRTIDGTNWTTVNLDNLVSDWNEGQLPLSSDTYKAKFSGKLSRQNENTLKLSISGNTTSSFEGTVSNLPAYDENGNKYTYVAAELKNNQMGAYKVSYLQSNGEYTSPVYLANGNSTYSDAAVVTNENGSFTETVKNELVVGTISANVVWHDAADRTKADGSTSASKNVDGVRPDNVTLTLTMKRNGDSSYSTVSNAITDSAQSTTGTVHSLDTVDTSYSADAKWKDLPVYNANGTKISYRVAQTDSTGKLNSYYKINGAAVAAQNIKAVSNWDSKNLQASIGKTGNGTKSQSAYAQAVVIAEGTDATRATTDTVVTLNNQHVPAKTEISVTKKWTDENNHELSEFYRKADAPDAKLYVVASAGTEKWLVPQTSTVDMSTWKYLGENLTDAQINAALEALTATEITTYRVVISGDASSFTKKWASMPRNAYNTGYSDTSIGTNVPVTYKVYEDVDDTPSDWYAPVDGIGKTVTQTNTNTATNDTGANATVTNKITTVDVEFTKTWKGDTTSVEFTVERKLAGSDTWTAISVIQSEVTATNCTATAGDNGIITVTGTNKNWTVKVQDLPKYNDAGTEYTYRVRETKVGGKELSEDGYDNGEAGMSVETVNGRTVFKNAYRNTQIQLQLHKKADPAATGTLNALAGASFQLKNGSTTVWSTSGSVGTADQLYKSISSAIAKISTKAPTADDFDDSYVYTLTETKAPAGYKKAADVQFVFVAGDGTLDSTYTMYYKTADGAWTAVTPDANGVAEYTIEDEPIVLSLEKLASEVINANALVIGANNTLKGAEFTISGKFATGMYTGVATTSAVTKDVKFGDNTKVTLSIASTEVENGYGFVLGETYTLTETKAPNGYKKLAAPITFTVGEDGKISAANGATVTDNKLQLEIENEPIKLQLEKQDLDGNKLSGYEFQITGIFADGTSSQTKTVNDTDKPISKLDNLWIADNQYTIVETKAPDGYERIEYNPVIAISNAGTVSFVGNHQGITVENVSGAGNIKLVVKDPEIALRINKYDGVVDADKLISSEADTTDKGYTFSITGEFLNDQGVYETKTYENMTPAKMVELDGKWRATYVSENAYHYYTIKETRAPYGYVLNETELQFYIFGNTNGQKPGTVVFTDGDVYTGNKTDTIKMVDAPITLTVKKVSSKNTSASIDSDTLGYAKFAVTGKFADAPTTEKTIEVTSKDAYEKLYAKLIYGNTYEVKETFAPNGYELDENPVTIQVSSDGTISVASGNTNYSIAANADNVLTLTMKDTPIELELEKQSPDGTELGGAEFKIEGTFADGETEKAIDADNLISDLDALWIYGEEYILTETKAPNGYELLQEDIVFTVTADGEVELDEADYVEVKDNKIGIIVKDTPIELELEKQNLDGTELEGAEFKIEGTFADDSTEKVIDADHWISNLDALWIYGEEYTLTETKAPNGYELLDEEIEFTVTEDGEVELDETDYVVVKDNKIGIIVKDTPIELELEKQNLDGETLTGAEFKIEGTFADDETEKVIDADNPISDLDALWIYDEDYTLTETKAPNGYKLLEDEIVFTVTEDGEVELKDADYDYVEVKDNKIGIIVKDTPIELELEKQNLDGTTLEGAEFKIEGTFADGDTEKVIDADNPISDLDALWIYGEEYTLTETKAPNGYELLKEEIEFTIDDDGEVELDETDYVAVGDNSIQIIVKDTPIELDLEKQNLTGDILTGAEFKITGTFADGDTEKVIDADNPISDLDALWIYGEEYTLTETKAPNGYELLDEEIEFTVTEDGEVELDETDYVVVDELNKIKIIVKDTPIELELEKQNLDGETLTGAEFKIEGTFADGETEKVIDAENPISDLDALWIYDEEYTLTETKAPNGYELIAEPVTFEVSDDGEITFTSAANTAWVLDNSNIKIVAKDEPIALRIKKYSTVEVDGEKKLLADTDDENSGFLITISGDFAGENNTYAEETYEDKTAKFMQSLDGKWLYSTDTETHEYTLVETRAPYGYVLETAELTFTIKEDGTLVFADDTDEIFGGNGSTVITLGDAPVGLSLTKKSTDGSAINETERGYAEFTITGIFADAQTEATKRVTSKTMAALDNLMIAGNIYTITETKAPNGYQLDAEPAYVIVNNDGTLAIVNDADHTSNTSYSVDNTANVVCLIMEDAPLTVTLKKVSESGADLTGAEFTVTGIFADAEDEATKNVTVDTMSDLDGLWIYGNTYVLTETAAPEGYKLPAEGYKLSFTVEDNNDLTIASEDLAVRPVTDDEGRVVKGADGSLYNYDDNAADTIVVRNWEETFLKIEKRWDDDQNISEIRPEEIVFTIEASVDGGNTWKTVQYDGKDLTVTLTGDSHEEIWTATVENLPKFNETEENGARTITAIQYRAVETVPVNYEVVYVVENENGEVTAAEIGDEGLVYTAADSTKTGYITTAINTPVYTDLDIVKKWTENEDGVYPESIEVQLMWSRYDEAAQAYGDPEEITDIDGTVLYLAETVEVDQEDGSIDYGWDDLPAMDAAGNAIRYSVVETKVIGYIAPVYDKEYVTYDVEEREIEITNQAIVIELAKYNAVTEELLGGASLALYRAEDVTVVEEDGVVVDVTLIDGKTAYDTWTSSDEETHVLRAIPTGDYYLVELDPPAKYEKAAPVLVTVVDEDTEGNRLTTIQSYSMNDSPYRFIELTKKSLLDDEYLADCDLAVYSMDDVDVEATEVDGSIVYTYTVKEDAVAIDSWTTVEDDPETEEVNENLHIMELPSGEYLFVEERAHEGYTIADPIKFVVAERNTADDNEVVELVMEDDYTKVQIWKVQKTNHDHHLEGAVLQLLDEDGNLVKDVNGNDCEWTSKADEAQVFYALPAGTYYIHEVKAPEGYRLELQDTQIVIEDTDDVQTFEFENVHQSVIPTGVEDYAVPTFLMTIIAALGSVLLFFRRKRRYA